MNSADPALGAPERVRSPEARSTVLQTQTTTFRSIGWRLGQPSVRHEEIMIDRRAHSADLRRRLLSDWLDDMKLVRASTDSCIERHFDYYGKYATSHDFF
jgi:hypothetical protein